MKTVTHVDGLGRQTIVQVPDGAPETTWGQGIVLGPPDLSSLGLREETTTRLHNELFNRGIVKRSDARARRAEVYAALLSTFKVDAEAIINLYEDDANA